MSLTFEVNHFKSLIEKFPTWDELRSYLESEEGGLLRIVDEQNGFCLIRLEKNVSKMDLPYSKWFRSVVWNTAINMPACIAPPKASTQEFGFNTIKELNDAGVVCQELLDGFMINCFRFRGDNTLHITSRSKLNAVGKFYSDKSFRELFMEAYMNTSDCPHYSETIIQDNSSDIQGPDSSKGELAIFYSFLVQHKEHRIVKDITENRVYVIHKGTVFEDGRVQLEDSPATFKDRPNIQPMRLESKLIKGSYAQIAARAVENAENNEVQTWIKNTLAEKSWDFQGLVFKDSEGNRWRFRSEKYGAVKSLRGNSANIRERFSQMIVQNLLHKYLEYYPEESTLMLFHLMLLNMIIKTIYDSYVDLHITKTKKAEEIEKIYLPHLYSIHGLYLSQLRPNGKKVNINEVQLYLHKQPWQRVCFLLKKLIDKMNGE
jgi:hypothetical protein